MANKNVTKEQIIQQFYGVQHRRCPVCEKECELGKYTAYDKSSGMVYCRRCYLLLVNIRAGWGPRLDWILALVRNEHINNNN